MVDHPNPLHRYATGKQQLKVGEVVNFYGVYKRWDGKEWVPLDPQPAPQAKKAEV